MFDLQDACTHNALSLNITWRASADARRPLRSTPISVWTSSSAGRQAVPPIHMICGVRFASATNKRTPYELARILRGTGTNAMSMYALQGSRCWRPCVQHLSNRRSDGHFYPVICDIAVTASALYRSPLLRPDNSEVFYRWLRLFTTSCVVKRSVLTGSSRNCSQSAQRPPSHRGGQGHQRILRSQPHSQLRSCHGALQPAPSAR